MHRLAPVALATLLAATAPALLCAQTPTPFTVPASTGHFTDPANLAGERVRPRNGRELPIDGGLSADGKPDNALALAQQLRRLNTRASLMLIVAHPDDEDGGMLTYYSRGLGARVAILTLNRGEGGQNQMTGDFEDALGLLRTQELLSADRYMGVTQMFGTEVDFGFTKTKQEAFEKWNHQRVLYDAVRAVRIYRPLIIASTFEGAVTDGHGQHQVSGEIAQEVFKAAGDPNVFPELTKEGILPWQPLKVYARVPFSRVSTQGLFDYATGQTVPAEFTNYVTGQTFTTTPSADVTISEGQPDPLLSTCAANRSDLPRSFSSLSSPEGGSASSSTATNCQPLSYVQFARIGLGLQRSQIGGGMRVPSPGRSEVSYHLYGSRVCAPNLPNPTPKLCTSSSTSALNNHDTGWPTLSRSERVGYRAARDKTPIVPAVLVSTTTSRAPTVPASFTSSKAPTARPITAQGDALGNEPENDPRAEGPAYSPVANQPSFYDGIDASFEGIAALAPHAPASLHPALHSIATSLEQAQTRFDANHPDAIAPLLEEADKQIGALTTSIPEAPLAPGMTVPSELRAWDSVPETERLAVLHELRIKKSQLAEALALSLGIQVDATMQDAEVQVGSTPTVHVHLTTTSEQPLTVFSIELGGRDPSSTDHAEHTVSSKSALDVTLKESQTSKVTRPYFTRASIEDPVYRLLEPSLRNAPATPWPLVVTVFVNHHDHMIVLERVIHSGLQPVQIIPSIDLHVVDADLQSIHARVIPNDAASTQVSLFHEPADAKLKSQTLTDSGAWKTHIAITDVAAPGETRFQIDAPRLPRTPVTLTGSATALDGTKYIEGFRPVGYGSLPRTNYYTPATLRVVPVDLNLPPENKRRIAYLPGTGDDVPAALASIGLTPTILKVSDLTADKLSHFDTIILGVRTYNAHPDLHGAPTQALLDFARNGGNVVLQTQTPEFGAADAPYPLSDRNERVIDETAPVKLLDPSSPLLTTPNKITSADFNGWNEERGHGFLDTWDSHYTALTETGDPGAPAEHIRPQEPQRGGLITVQLGKGRWTYVAFALYRQLPEAVPGAFRLFVNLLNP